MTANTCTAASDHGGDELGASSSVDLAWYLRKIEPTDRLPPTDLNPVLMGLFGEVGGILATLKKHVRDRESYADYEAAVAEEFGDALWYFAALCRRLDIRLESVGARIPTSTVSREIAAPLLELGRATAGLLRISGSDTQARHLLREFWECYVKALRAANLDLRTVASRNLRKASGRFLAPDSSSLPTFDEAFPSDERLPENFEVTISQRPSGQTFQQWKGVFIGDPLTDNIADRDGYRYHDVFHLANAAILHWSPVFRSLIKHKRKTCPDVDETQDGGRAIVVEEGLTAWIFSRAKQLDFFERHTRLSYDLLKTVEQFVRGYEVEQCPLNLWETAILGGYRVFRELRANSGGVIVGNRSARTIEYRALAADH